MEPVTLSRTLMGSPFTFTAYPAKDMPEVREELAMLLELAAGEVRRVEDLLTDYRPSPLTGINDLAGIRPARVPREVFDLIAFACRVSRETQGAFDITYAAVGSLWREAFNTGIAPDAEALDEARRLVDFRRIRLDAARGTVFLTTPGMRIGLGSIGKAYGVDSAYTLLRALGVGNFFINGAGDIRAHSFPQAPRPWRIGIRNPFDRNAAPAGVISIANGAVVTSGDYERFIECGGKRCHHIIDARTGEIRDDVASVTVTAGTAVIANACSTAAMAMGIEDGKAYLGRKSGIRGLIISSYGEYIRCSRSEEEIITKGGQQ